MSVRAWLVLPVLGCMAVTGCNDDDDDTLVADGGILVDGGRVDGGIDASVDGGITYPDLKIVKTVASENGHDRFFGVAYDATGSIYAVGQTSTGTANSDDTSMLVAKFTSAGELDKSFGAGKGWVAPNVTPGGQNVEAGRGILVQASGKIVIAGEADHAVTAAGIDGGVVARDTDIVLARLNADGTLDSTFGTAGVARLDLGTGVEVSSTLADGGTQVSLGGADTTWSLSQTSDGKLVIHGTSRATGIAADGGPRTDNDYTLVRLTENGALDTTFATVGYLRTDVGEVNGSARSATVLADNSIVAAGYTTSTVLGASTQQPVLYKVTPAGVPDSTFAAGGLPDQLTTPGVWHGYAREDRNRAEAYGAAPQGDKFVTVGYGPTPNTTGSGSDWVFFRFNADGSQDKTFGTGGQTFIDAAKYSDNGRAITTLPDGRVLAVGGGRPAPAVAPAAGTQPTNVDGMISVLTPAGLADATFAPGGFRLLDWGNSDFLHACKVAPGSAPKQVAIVGAAGGGTEATSDDDGVLLLLTLP